MKTSSILFLLFFIACAMAKYLPFDPACYAWVIFFFTILLIGKLFILPPHTDQHLKKPAPIITQKSAVVFDLHGVVFRFSPLKAVHAAFTTKHKRVLLKAVSNPFLIWDVVKLLHTSAVVEQAIMAIAHKYPNLKDVIPLALKMANEQVPIEQTILIIKQLKANGFKIFVFSNIGEQSAQILQEKYPQIFALFDGILVTTAQDNYVMKPSEQAFMKFLNKFNLKKEQIIFIDDKKSNVRIARNMGIYSIQFINPQQCQQVLQQLQILKQHP